MSQDRYGTVRCALEHLRGRVLVEVGSLRTHDLHGGSTFVFGLAAVAVGGFLYSIDINMSVQTFAREVLRPLETFIGFPNGDAADVLMKMRVEVACIDLLYLDGGGPGPKEQITNVPYQEESVAQIKAAWPLLCDDSVILLDDDCRGLDTGKPVHTRKFLAEHGWQCVMDEYQSVWVSGDRK